MMKKTFEEYLINVGIRSSKFTYEDDILFDYLIKSEE